MKALTRMPRIKGKLALICAATCMIFALPTGSTDAAPDQGDTKILEKTGKAFSEVAKKAIPAVVYIQSEKTVTVGGGYHSQPYNNPYG